MNFNFFQKPLSSRLNSCLVLNQNQYSLDNEKILKLLRYDLKEISELIIGHLANPEDIYKSSSYLTVWKLLVENSLSPDLITAINPGIVPGIINGGSGRVFLLFLVDMVALYGDQVNLGLTMTALLDQLPPDNSQDYQNQINNIQKPSLNHNQQMDIAPPLGNDITDLYSKVLTTSETFLEVLNFNNGKLSENTLARDLHAQLLEMKKTTDNWLAILPSDQDSSLLVICLEKLLGCFKALEEMANAEKQSKNNYPGRDDNEMDRDLQLALELSKNESQPQYEAEYASGSGTVVPNRIVNSSEEGQLLVDFDDKKGKGRE